MNKWFILVASCFLILGSAYTVPFALKNPSTVNVIVSGLITIFAFAGLVMFAISLAGKNPKVSKEYTPVED